jgi:dephospho-CoA kinase
MFYAKPMIVIGIIGPKAAGKDTVATYFEYKYGFGHHAHSDVYRDILSILRVPKSRDNLINLVELRKIFGEDVLINALNKRIKAHQSPVQIVTGIRFQNELDNIKTYPQNLILHIDAPIEKRYEYQVERKQNIDDTTMTFEEFVLMEARETEKHIQDLAKFADAKIENQGSKEDLYEKAEEILKPLIEKRNDLWI